MERPRVSSRVAVVGGGGAGLVAAWRLAERYHVTVYEAEPAVGGHARTVHVPTTRGELPVDMGVELFNERSWPNLCAILDHLDLETFPAPLTFAASFGPSGYWENDPRCRSPLWLRLRDECSRFHADMHRVVAGVGGQDDIAALTIGDYMTATGYTDEFMQKALIPTLTIFSGSRAPLAEFSLLYTATCFTEGMLSFLQPPYYRKVVGGLSQYLHRLAARVQAVRTSCRVVRVSRSADRVVIRDDGGSEDTFEQVLLCTHADIALSLLADPTDLERELLGAFRYHEATSVVHTDARILAPGLPSRPACEFVHLGRSRGGALDGSVTRNVSVIHELDPKLDPIFVTINPQIELDPSRVIDSKAWKHPLLRPPDLDIKRRIREIQGQRRTWFGGLDTTFTGHESAVVCGLLLSEALGVPYPFADNHAASTQRGRVRDLMGLPARDQPGGPHHD